MQKSDLSQFLSKFPAKNYKPREIIHYSGQASIGLFYLKRGFVRQYITSTEGKELTVHIFEKGSIFPLVWAFGKSWSEFNLQTLTSCQMAIVPETKYMQFLKSSPEELLKLTDRLMSGIIGLSKRLEIVSFDNANQRVKSTLMYLKKHFGSRYHFSHEDIASLTGLTRERVSIEMKKLKDAGIIDYKHANVTFITESPKS